MTPAGHALRRALGDGGSGAITRLDDTGTLHGTGRRLALIGGLLTAVLAVSTMAPADAAPQSTNSVRSQAGTSASEQVFPTQAQVDAARAVARTGATRLDQAQAEYAAATLELQRVQAVVVAAAAQADSAEATLETRTREADAAAADAADATSQAASANKAVRQSAALLWQDQGNADDWTIYLTGDGPQAVADRVSSLAHLSDARQSVLDRATATANLASEADRRVTVALAQQQAATEEAREARAVAQAEVDAANRRTQQLSAQQDALVGELAHLQGVAVQVAQDRQDALAVAAAAKAAADRAAAARVEEERRLAAAATPPAQPAPSGSTSQPSAPSTPPPPPPPPTPTPPAPTTPQVPWVPGGGLTPSEARATARSMLSAWGWGDDQWSCLDTLWTGESNWRWNALNRSSGAYGIPQSLPASKMSTAGSDWLTNPRTQISWGMTYIKGRYGSPCGALAAWQARSPHWY